MAGFWAGRRVLITGHTGFKGAWLAFWLAELGAEVSGLALPPDTKPNLHDILDLPKRGRFVHADINDRAALDALMRCTRPEVVIHMAAQALVRRSYAAPIETFAANVVGVVTLLDVVRHCPETRAVVIVTSDKAYENLNWSWGYRETDSLGGHDPYSASKACSEIAAASMRRAFFHPGGHPARIATARAGNVIGGGDWAEDRLTPDIVRGCLGEEGVVRLRNPSAVRPWQHVLEPLGAYLMLAERLCAAPDGVDEAWNIGPDAAENRPVLAVAEALVAALGRGRIEVTPKVDAPHEAHLLALDCAKARARLGWRPRLDFDATISLTASWYSAWARGETMAPITRGQIAAFTEAGT
ncbi:CDP-glucose 4,6-dehydratase [Methylocapsa sp. S129]|uniref:CDP-glucose 4,6-dehydratase n=1 Tax=Methylocapsa sp. S129 TaxID=1641869 RepID=UPI00131AF0E1|nr:CDP-glucose 4,6-dehydratase [Methylocapsa sp. S129]